MVSDITYHRVKFSKNHCLLEATEKAWQCTIAVMPRANYGNDKIMFVRDHLVLYIGL